MEWRGCMKKCPKCGKDNRDEAKFCIWCGEEIPEIHFEEKKKGKKPVIWVLAAVLLLLGGGALGMFFQSRLYEEKEALQEEQEAEVSQDSAEEKPEQAPQNETSQSDSEQNNSEQNDGTPDEENQTDQELAEQVEDSSDEDIQIYTENYLAPFKNENGQWGYIDPEGNVVIECKYDAADGFGVYGFARVGMNSQEVQNGSGIRYGMINENGDEIIPCEYDIIQYDYDLTGNEYIKIGNYRNTDPVSYYKGIVDESGNIYLSSECNSLSRIGDSDYFIAESADQERYGIVNSSLEWVCDARHSELEVLTENSQPYKINGEYVFAAICDYQEGGYSGIINMQGDLLVSFNDYVEIDPEVQQGMISVKNNEGFWGLVDLQGIERVPCIYNQGYYAIKFQNRREACVNVNDMVFLVDKDGNETYIADGIGEQIDDDHIVVIQDDGTGIMNISGGWLIEPVYSDCRSNDFYYSGNWRNDGGNGILINKEGNAINTSYSMYDLFFNSENVICVGTDSYYGAIDASGNEIVECRYFDSTYVSDEWRLFCNPDYSGSVLINCNGEKITGDFYDCAVSEDGKYISVYQMDGKSTLFDEHGNFITEYPENVLFVGEFNKVINN